MITPRLILMRELLSEEGSIYVHLDWHVGHYVKLVLDEIFGKANFRNEIVWSYFDASKAMRHRAAKKYSAEARHDLPLFRRGSQYHWHATHLHKPHSP